MNRLIVIGELGNKECYLNWNRVQAIADYQSKYPYLNPNRFEIEEIEFDSVFRAYDVWNSPDD